MDDERSESSIVCPSCLVQGLECVGPKKVGVSQRAKSLGIRSVPAVVVDGTLAACCAGRGPDEAALRSAGLGQPIP